MVFIGLTTQKQSELGQVKGFLKSHGVKWRNGYGARKTLTGFEAQYIPTVWVIGRDGKVVWNKASYATMEAAIEDALAELAPAKSK